jgi:short-subunit dehydrogenase
MDVNKKVVIITGASMGIGLSTARLFAAAGAKVVLAARSADRLQVTAEELHQQGFDALALPVDMCDTAAVQNMVETTVAHYGRIDILINNAGQACAGSVAEVSPTYFQKIIDLNLFGPLYAIQAVVPKMRQNGGGLIINISSMVSKMSIPGLGTYAATKSALNMLSDTARGELAPDNIRVITVYPRLTSTDFGKNSLGERTTRQHQRSGATAGGMTADTPEWVAERILAAARDEPKEQFMDA